MNSARTFWTDDRLTRLGVAFLVALIAACIFKYFNDPDLSSALKRGDFPGIYSPAVILAEGKAERFYDIALHHEIQSRIWPSFSKEIYISVYPPFFGALLIPLAHLDPEVARNLWTVICVLCYVGALYLLRPVSPAIREHFLFIATSFLLFAPVMFGVLAGQNTAISMLLFVAAMRLLKSKGKGEEFLAGVLFGLWLFKPQFGIIAGGYLLFAGRKIALVGFGLVAVLYWLLAAYYLGPNWIALWLDATNQFAAINFGINDYQMASFAGFLSSLTRGVIISTGLVLPLSLVLTLVTLLVVWKGRTSSWILGPVIVLCSPQTLFYDLSIALTACLALVTFKSDQDVNAYLLSGILTGVLFALRDHSFIALPWAIAVATFLFVYCHSLKTADT